MCERAARGLAAAPGPCARGFWYSPGARLPEKAPSGNLGFLPSSRLPGSVGRPVPGSPCSVLLHGARGRCRVPSRSVPVPRAGGRVRPCPQPTRPRPGLGPRAGQRRKRASCLKPHPRHSSQRHPGGISRGAWAGLESKASLPAPAGWPASPGLCCAMPSRAVPCRATEGPGGRGPRQPTSANACRRGARPSAEGRPRSPRSHPAAGYRLRCFHHDLTAQPARPCGAGASPAGSSVPLSSPPRCRERPGRGCPPALCVVCPPLWCSPCTHTHICAHLCTAPPRCAGPHRALLWEAAAPVTAGCPHVPSLLPPPLGTGRAPAAAAGSCPCWQRAGPACPGCVAWHSAARHGTAQALGAAGVLQPLRAAVRGGTRVCKASHALAHVCAHDVHAGSGQDTGAPCASAAPRTPPGGAGGGP